MGKEGDQSIGRSLEHYAFSVQSGHCCRRCVGHRPRSCNLVRCEGRLLEAVTGVLVSDRVGVRISPSSVFNGMGDSHPQELYRQLAERLKDFRLANFFTLSNLALVVPIRLPKVRHPLPSWISAGIFAEHCLLQADLLSRLQKQLFRPRFASLIAIGRYYTSNPDLPYRIAHDLPPSPYDRNTSYASTAKGNTDFPTYEESRAASAP
jgi:N-ethylmaleimide reductase